MTSSVMTQPTMVGGPGSIGVGVAIVTQRLLAVDGSADPPTSAAGSVPLGADRPDAARYAVPPVRSEELPAIIWASVLEHATDPSCPIAPIAEPLPQVPVTRCWTLVSSALSVTVPELPPPVRSAPRCTPCIHALAPAKSNGGRAPQGPLMVQTCVGAAATGAAVMGTPTFVPV